MFNSLRSRLLISTNILLIVLFTASAYMLDNIYRTNLTESEANRLHAQLVELSSIAESSFGMNTSLSEDRENYQLLYKNSGLYAMMLSEEGRVVWQSPSMHESDIYIPKGKRLRKNKFYELDDDGKGPLFVSEMNFNWVAPEGLDAVYTFIIAKSQKEFWAQVNHFRESLLFWMIPLYVLAVLVHYFILRWGFLPLVQVGQDLRDIERGKADSLKGKFPYEIQSLTTNINELITHERKRQIQYQNALGDLAHSLKTPLAVIASSINETETSSTLKNSLNEQIAEVDNMISYQLKRATHGTQNTFAPSTPIKPLVDKLIRAMEKIYVGKGVVSTFNLSDDNISYQAQSEDLYELLGNLIENAYKYCEYQVRRAIGGDNRP